MSHELVRARVCAVLLGLASSGAPCALALELVGSLAEKGRFDAADVLWRYLEAHRIGGCDAGPTSDAVFRQLHRGISHPEALRRTGALARPNQQDAGPILRGVGLALAPALPDAALRELARQEAALTHTDPLPGAASGALVVLLRALLRGAAWDAALDLAREGQSVELSRAFTPVRHMTLSSEIGALALISTAIYFVDQSTDLVGAERQCQMFTRDSAWHLALARVVGQARFGGAPEVSAAERQRATELAKGLPDG